MNKICSVDLTDEEVRVLARFLGLSFEHPEDLASSIPPPEDRKHARSAYLKIQEAADG